MSLDNRRRLEAILEERKRKAQEQNLEEVRKRSPLRPKTQRERMPERIISWGIFGLLVLSPLAKGGVNEWSLMLFQAAVFALTIVYLVAGKEPAPEPRLFQALKWPRYLFTGLLALVLLQIFPWPGFLVKLVSPHSAGFRELYSFQAGGLSFMGISIIPSQTFRAGLELLAYILLGFLVLKTVTRRRQILRLVYAVVGMGIFQAFYGLFELYSTHPRLLFYNKVHYLNDATGTFVNRNHFSGYLEMAIPLAVGLLLARSHIFATTGLTLKDRLLKLLEKSNYKTLLLVLGVVLMAVAVVFSRSRSGVSLLVLTFVLFLGMSAFFARTWRDARTGARRILKVTFLGIVFLCLFVGIDSTLERFALDNILREARPKIWASTLDMAGSFPVLGAGLGTYAALYPAFEGQALGGQVSHAHNDYLEFLAELGLAGTGLLAAGILMMLGGAFLMWRVRRNPEVKGLALGGMIAVVNLLLHSITDFNLHIPANAILFAVILPLTLVTAFFEISDRRAGRSQVPEQEISAHMHLKPRRAGMQRLPLGLRMGLVAALAAAFVLSVGMYWSRHLYYRALNTSNLEEKTARLEAAVKIYPFDFLGHYALGGSQMVGAMSEAEGSGGMRSGMLHAEQSLERSIRLNPAFHMAHYRLGQVRYYLSFLETGSERDYLVELKRAARLAGHDTQVLLDVGKALLGRWDELDGEDREFAREVLKKLAHDPDPEKFQELLLVWEMNVRDYALLLSILPEDVRVFRAYGRFLGEKSLSSFERQRALAFAEGWEFASAEERFKQGERAFMYLRTREALRHYRASLGVLDRIRFYQDLVEIAPIDSARFKELSREARLKLIKCLVREGSDLTEIRPLVQEYLDREERDFAVDELYEYLLEKGLFMEFGAFQEDLDRLSFQMDFLFRQGRFREIVRFGELLKQSFVVVPEGREEPFRKILRLIGRAYANEGFVYDAGEFYQRAYDMDPRDLETLLAKRCNLERLNDRQGAERLSAEIAALTCLEGVGEGPVSRGEEKRLELPAAGGSAILELSLEPPEEGSQAPLLSVVFNGRVVWDGYVEEGPLLIPVESQPGTNRLLLQPVNTGIVLRAVRWAGAAP